jgi:hypothetical protein
MNRRTPSVSLAPPTPILLCLMLLAPGIARAQTGYKIQPIVKLGDTVADVLIRAKGDLEIGTLNDYNAPRNLDNGISYRAVSEPERKTRAWRHSETITVPSSKPR